MTSYERVMRRLEGKPVDKIPNLNIVMLMAAKQIGVPYGKYVTDYRYLVEGNLKCCELFGIDAVCAISDPMREAHSFGAKVIIPEDDVPCCKEHLIKDYDQVKTLKPANPMEDERMLDRIRAIELFKQQVGGTYPIIGWVEGALAEASDLRGINDIMVDLMLEPERVVELFEVIYTQQLAFAKAQIEAGADMIGIGDAAASLIGPDLYKQYVVGYEKRIIEAIHQMGAKAKLHICGNIEPLLELIVDTKADIVDIDWMVSFEKAANVFKDTGICPNGNMDPVSVFLQGNKVLVEEKVKACISVGGNTSFISAGCEIPRGTPEEHLQVMNSLLYK